MKQKGTARIITGCLKSIAIRSLKASHPLYLSQGFVPGTRGRTGTASWITVLEKLQAAGEDIARFTLCSFTAMATRLLRGNILEEAQKKGFGIGLPKQKRVGYGLAHLTSGATVASWMIMNGTTWLTGGHSNALSAQFLEIKSFTTNATDRLVLILTILRSQLIEKTSLRKVAATLHTSTLKRLIVSAVTHSPKAITMPTKQSMASSVFVKSATT